MAAKKEEAAAVDQEKKISGKLKWMLLAVLLVFLAGGGFAAYWFLMGPAASHEEEDGERVAPTPAQQRLTPEIVSLPSFIVNLADPLGRRFLRVTMDVEVAGREAATDLNRSESRIRDSIILLLSSKAYADLASMESKIILKNEIVYRLNQIIGEGKVSNVYFTEFVIQ